MATISNYANLTPQLTVENNVEIVTTPAEGRLCAITGPCKSSFTFSNFSTYLEPVPYDAEDEPLNSYFKGSTALIDALTTDITVDTTDGAEPSNFELHTLDSDNNGTTKVTGDTALTFKKDKYGAVTFTIEDGVADTVYYIVVPNVVEIDYNSDKLALTTSKALKKITSTADILINFGEIKFDDDDNTNNVAFAANLALTMTDNTSLYVDAYASNSSYTGLDKSLNKLALSKYVKNLAIVEHLDSAATALTIADKLYLHITDTSTGQARRWRRGFLSCPMSTTNIATDSNITSLASKYNEELLTFVLPFGKSYMSVTSDSGAIVEQEIPNEYHAAVVAAISSSVLVQQSISRWDLTYISSIPDCYSGSYTFDDMNNLASYGIMLLVQDDESTTPYIKHQLTMNTTDGIMYQEQSVWSNTQDCNYVMESVNEPYYGKVNLTDAFLSRLATETKQALTALTVSYDSTAESLCGVQLLSVDNVSVTRDSTYNTHILNSADVTVAVPGNVIKATINTYLGT